ncbi:uncharacterized protein [Antedon mediterranea]|uniref:uncharacterized protein n=1 Tax=Antedon mediterranea TaxID=105859 RepID=UPI003AF8C702
MIMFYLICLLFFTSQLNIIEGANNECTYFQYNSSMYRVNSLTNTSTETWQDLKDICKASGGYLMCITTSGELQFVLDRLNMSCSGHRFGIGLSRQPDLEINVDANWKCEGDGTTLDTKLTPWADNDDKVPIGTFAGTRIMTNAENLRDINTRIEFAKRNDGYICEYDTVLFQTVTLSGGVNDWKMSPIRCAQQCRRRYDCQGFHVDAAGCQLRYKPNNDETNHYNKIIYHL